MDFDVILPEEIRKVIIQWQLTMEEQEGAPQEKDGLFFFCSLWISGLCPKGTLSRGELRDTHGRMLIGVNVAPCPR